MFKKVFHDQIGLENAACFTPVLEIRNAHNVFKALRGILISYDLQVSHRTH